MFGSLLPSVRVTPALHRCRNMWGTPRGSWNSGCRNVEKRRDPVCRASINIWPILLAFGRPGKQYPTLQSGLWWLSQTWKWKRQERNRNIGSIGTCTESVPKSSCFDVKLLSGNWPCLTYPSASLQPLAPLAPDSDLGHRAFGCSRARDRREAA